MTSSATNQELISKASAHFPEKPLSEAEKRLLQGAPTGDIAICGPKLDDSDETNDPNKAECWESDREIRADLIRWICVDPEVARTVDPRGIQVYGAKIIGKIDLSYVTVSFPIGFRRCIFSEDAELGYLTTAGLDFAGSKTRALNLDGASVGGDVCLNNSFYCDGGIRLLTAKIGNNLECNGGTFLNRSGHALWADRIKIAGSAFLGRAKRMDETSIGVPFKASGTVRLVGAQIGGVLNCSGGLFREPVSDGSIASTADLTNALATAQPSSKRAALNCDRMKVLNIFLNDDFSAEGEVMLRGAEISINLTCTDGTFKNPNQIAISADGSKIGGGVYLDGTFNAQGSANFLNCQLGGDMICKGGEFTKLNLTRTTIKGSLIWCDVQHPQTVQLDLTNATTGPLEDSESSWPGSRNLNLDGFSYSRISGMFSGDIEARLRWLSLSGQFSMQPYQQLARVLRDSGDAQGAHRVIYSMEHRRRQDQNAGGLEKIKNWILRWTIGYGQIPLRALWWLLVLTIVGCTISGLGYLAGGIAPLDKEAYAIFQKSGYPPEYLTPFNPFIYSLEHSFPLVNLGLKEHWGPNSGGPAVAPIVHSRLLQLVRENHLLICSAGLLRWWMWAQTLSGWVLATLFVAGLTGIVKTT